MRLFHCSFSPVKEMFINFFTRHTSLLIIKLEVSSMFQPGLEIRMHTWNLNATCRFANARKSTIVHPVHPIFAKPLLHAHNSRQLCVKPCAAHTTLLHSLLGALMALIFLRTRPAS